MKFDINDKTLISEITNEFYKIAISEKEKYNGKQFMHPLDDDIKELLQALEPSSGESIEYSQIQKLDELWEKLINKSIICLRFFDEREPFQKDPKKKR